MAEIESCGGEGGVNAVAFLACKPVPSQQPVVFGVSDHRLHYGPALEPTLDFIGDAALLSGNEDLGIGMVFKAVAFISLIDGHFLWHAPDDFLDVFQRVFECVSVIGVAVQCLGVENEVAPLAES